MNLQRGTFLCPTELNTDIIFCAGRDARVVVPYTVKYILCEAGQLREVIVKSEEVVITCIIKFTKVPQNDLHFHCSFISAK